MSLSHQAINDLVARLFVRPELLGLTPAIVADDGMRRRQNITVGTVVLLQFDDLGVRKVFLKVQNIADIRTAPLVDALVVVPHHAEILMLPWRAGG